MLPIKTSLQGVSTLKTYSLPCAPCKRLPQVRLHLNPWQTKLLIYLQASNSLSGIYPCPLQKYPWKPEKLSKKRGKSIAILINFRSLETMKESCTVKSEESTSPITQQWQTSEIQSPAANFTTNCWVFSGETIRVDLPRRGSCRPMSRESQLCVWGSDLVLEARRSWATRSAWRSHWRERGRRPAKTTSQYSYKQGLANSHNHELYKHITF